MGNCMYYAEMENLYKILGVTNDAEDVVIKAAYRALAQRYHPDKFDGPKAEAERKMRDINYAYSILSDPGKRMVFDEQMASSNRDTPVDSQDSSYQGANDIGSSPTNVTPTKVHPWRRYFAKLIDWWILWGTLTGVVVYFLHPDITTGNAFFAKVLLLFFVIGIVGEACLLWGLGSTLGKWLFGIRVLDGGGRHLEFSTALKRSFLCLAQGCAMNIPLASTVANVFAYQRLKKTGSTRWDDSTGAAVVCEKTGLFRISFAVISVVAVVIVSSILTMSERGNHIPVKTVEPVVDRQQQDLLQAAQEIMAKFPQLDVESVDKDQVAIDFVGSNWL